MGLRQSLEDSRGARLLNLFILRLSLVPVLNVILVYWVNGSWLGREDLEMVALRRRTQVTRASYDRCITCASCLLGWLSRHCS
jgi:hypothetical protein